MIHEDLLGGFRRVTLLAGSLRVSVLPELGGKIITLSRADGRNVLLEPPGPPYRRASPGDRFDAHDTSGMDECFPTVAACPSPDGPGELPDHGALWSRPWSFEAAGATLRMQVECELPRARFERRLSISGGALKLDYRVRSLDSAPFRWVWSAHPLLAVSVGSEIVLPREVRSAFVDWSTRDRLGAHGARCDWTPALAKIPAPEARVADKLFTGRLTTGRAALWDAASDEHVLLRFDTRVMPFLGLWICAGGWPAFAEVGHYTVALEPCSAPFDSAAEAAARSECPTLAPGAAVEWALAIELGKGRPSLDDAAA